MPIIGGIRIPDSAVPTGVVSAGPRRDSLGAIFGAAAIDAYGNLRYGLPAAVERAAGTLTPADEQYYAAWQAQKTEQARAFAPTGAAGFQDLSLFGGNVGLGRFLGENVAQMVPYLAGNIAGGLAGSVIGPEGAVAGAVLAGSPQYVGSNAARALNETGHITRDQAVKSLAVAPFQSALDVAEEVFTPGLGELFGPLAARFASKATGLTGTAVRAGKGALTGAAVEALSETAQQGLERYGAGLPLTDHDAMREYVQSFGSAAVLGGAFGGVAGAYRRKVQAQPSGQASNADLQNVSTEALGGALPEWLRTPVGEQGELPLTNTVPPRQAIPLSNVAPDTQLELHNQYTDNLGEPPPPAPPGTPGGPGLPETATQADLGLGPPISQFPPGYQPDLLQPNTYEALNAALAEQPTEALQAVVKKERAKKGAASPIADAAEQVLASRQSAAPAAEPTFEDRLAELKKGRKNDFIAKLNPVDETDLQDKVHAQIFDAQDERQTTAKLAQKLGILDDNLEPTDLAREIEARRAQPVAEVTPEIAPAPVDPAFATELEGIKKGSYDPEIKALTATNPEELDAQVYRAMAGRSGFTEEEAAADLAAGRKGTISSPSDAMETLAQMRGIYDDQGQLTDKGRTLALAEPVATEDASTAAITQGYTGALASSFERGAQGAPFVAPDLRGNLEDVANLDAQLTQAKAAYAAGQKWKVPPVTSSVAQTDATVGKLAPNTKAQTGGSTVVERDIELSDPQRTAQRLNLKLDDARLGDNNAAEVKGLKDLITKGQIADETTLQEHIDLVNAGWSVVGPEYYSKTLPFTPATSIASRRTNVALRDANTAAKQELAADKLGVGQQSKAQNRAETARAVQKKLLREEVRAAYNSNDLGPTVSANRLAYMRLMGALSEGRIEAVKAGLPGAGFTGDEMAGSVLFDPVEATKMELMLHSAGLDGVLKYLKAEAPTPFHRILANAIERTMKALTKAGMKFEFHIAHNGDQAPATLLRSRAYTRTEDGKVDVWLNGQDVTGREGVSYQALAHEMVHAATTAAILAGNRVANRGLKFFQPTQDLITVSNQIVAHFKNRARQGNLTDFERQVIGGVNNAIRSEREVMTWALTNPEMQAYLNTFEVIPSQTMWSRLVDAVRNFLDLDAKDTSALAEVMRVADRLFASIQEQVELESAPDEVVEDSMISGSLAQAGAALRQIIPEISTEAATAKLPDKMATGRRGLLGWVSVDHMAQVWGKWLPGLTDVSRVDRERHATDAKFSQLVVGWYQGVLQTPAETQKRLARIARLTEFGADPTKRWEDQPHLHDHPNASDLEDVLKEANGDYNTLVRAGQAHVYDDARAINKTMLNAELAVRLSSMVNFDPEYKTELPGFAADSMGNFREDLNASASPQAASAYWEKTLTDRVKMAQDYIDAQRGVLIRLDPAGQSKVEQHLNPLESQLKDIARVTARAERAPYFHLGRHGDQFVAFTVKNQNGVADKGAILKLVTALDKAGFGDKLYVSTETGRANVYFRGETIEQARQIEALAKKLKADGALDPEVDIIGGPREASGKGASRAGKQVWLDTMLQQLRSDPAFDTAGLTKDERSEVNARRNAIEKQLQSMWLDTVSDNSLAKVMVNRKAVPGYDADMMRSFAQRAQQSSKALANITAAPQYNDALGNMRAAVNDARRVDSPLHDQVQGMFDVTNEIMRRQAERMQTEHTVLGDKLRAASSVALLGMSPSYVLLQMTQVPMLLLPELGAKHGFVKSAKAIAQATGPAFKIMSATFAAARATGDWKHLGDVAITPEVIKNAGLSPGEAQFIARKIADGDIDIGSAVRTLGWVSDGRIGSKSEAAIRLGSAMGLYAETLTRLIAALATRTLYADGKVKIPVEDYASSVIQNAMFNYATSNTARNMGKTGVFGPATPIMFQFQQFSAQLMEKLYREGYDAFKGDTPESRAEARRFLAGHATMVTAFAGMLGLPFATVGAWAIEKLVDLFDDDDTPYDATAAFRQYMAGIFGKGVGEMLSRGVIPRGLGFDLSSRAGEQNILPFTELLTDQRSWKDALGAQSERSLGASFSVGTTMLGGAAKMLQGDLYGGAVDMMPVALKGPLKAGRMAETGEYIDAKGNKLPITPGAGAILYQLLGLNSSERAEYSEKANDQAGRRISLGRQATVLRNQIVKGVLSNDGGLKDKIRAAQKFDINNPEYAVLPDIEGAMKRRVTAEATARALGTPLGVRAVDDEARALTNY